MEMWLLFCPFSRLFKDYSYIFIIGIPIDATAIGGLILYLFYNTRNISFIFSLTLNCCLSSINITITIPVTSSISSHILLDTVLRSQIMGRKFIQLFRIRDLCFLQDTVVDCNRRERSVSNMVLYQYFSCWFRCV